MLYGIGFLFFLYFLGLSTIEYFLNIYLNIYIRKKDKKIDKKKLINISNIKN